MAVHHVIGMFFDEAEHFVHHHLSVRIYVHRFRQGLTGPDPIRIHAVLRRRALASSISKDVDHWHCNNCAPQCRRIQFLEQALHSA